MTADELVTFWSELGTSKVHPEDCGYLSGGFATDLYPVPWTGPLKHAEVYFLYLNPGRAGDEAAYEAKNPAFVDALSANLRGDRPYLYLSEQFNDHPGARWTRTTFGGDIDGRYAGRICVLQLVPYHSEKGGVARAAAPRLTSSKMIRRFVRHALIPKAHAGEIGLVVARSSRLWGIGPEEQRGSVLIYDGAECRRAYQTPGSRGGKLLRGIVR